MYNKTMGVVDFADMLIALYRIRVKTKRWYMKVFWHLVDICKVNACDMHRRDYSQFALPSNKILILCQFAKELGKVLMHANKAPTPNQRGRASKRQSSSGTNPQSSIGAHVPTPGNDIWYDNIGHWPEAVDKKERCSNCQEYSRMKCMKWNLTLCLLKDRNYFHSFHTNKDNM